jgi:hypothetical protein
MRSSQSQHSGCNRFGYLQMVARVALSLSALLTVFSSCHRRRESVSLPDLTRCTRIEVCWPRGILECSFPDAVRLSGGILDANERQYIRSLEPYKITDPNAIRRLGDILRQGSYVGQLKGKLAWSSPIQIDCYRDDEHMALLTVCGTTVVANDRTMFEYPMYVSQLDLLEPQELHPFRIRFECASNLANGLYGAGPLWRGHIKEYPRPATWCDAIVSALRDRSCTDKTITRVFACPAASIAHKSSDASNERPRESYYAMNPSCAPESPSNTVLLFETRPGWNQHGGPKLFTFDNHDPKGGCVLLNDGTVKFIRTAEELKQLRWK